MKPLDVAAICARAAAATPGEWRATRNSRDAATVHLAPTLMFDTEIALLRDFADNENDPSREHLMADADFIAAARSDVPALCARVEQLEAALREILVGKRHEDLQHPLGEWFSMAGRFLNIARAALGESVGA